MPQADVAWEEVNFGLTEAQAFQTACLVKSEWV